MEFWVALMLFGAGIMAGIVNAVAGGSTLFTFPTLMAAGLSPIVANASNALAITPANLVAVIADWGQLPRRGHAMIWLVVIALLGGFLGALLLLATSERLFTQLVPLLIGSATVIFAFSRKIHGGIQRWAGALAQGRPRLPLVLGLLAPVSVYGGYFGAGLGIMLMSIFALGGIDNLRRANALKNLLSVMCGLAAIVTFIIQGVISWPETMAMLAGAVIGGFLGGRLIRVLPAGAMRGIIITVGALLSAVYAGRYWF